MAYDYEKAKAAYESLSPEQRKAYVDSHKDDANMQRFASEYAREKSQASTTPTTPTTNYQNQGAGTYKYNESTGYYENQTDTTKNTVNQGIAPRPESKQETIIKETPTKQEEIVVSTDTKNNKTNTLTPLSNSYYQQTSDEALNKIKDNLNQYRQTNPEYFSDYDSFKKNFSYDLRNDEQKNVLDTWYTGYTKGLELSATPTTDLYTQYQNGEISINDLENLRVSNPTKYAELTAQINKGNIISAYDDDKGADKMNIQEMAYEMAAQTFKAFMEGGSGASSIFAEYEEKMNDPEMLALSDQCTEYEAEIEQIQDDIASMKKQVEAEYEGTGASRAKINAIIADRTYDLQLQLRTANSNYNKVANQYNNRMQQYQQEYTMKLQEYQLNMQARNQQMNELGFAMDLMNFETNEQKQEREWNYWVRQQEYQNGNINSKDYQTRYKAALTSVQNLLSQYEGIPMERSAEQMAQDVLKAIDGGSDLGAELTKINKLIQQKPEYKYLYNNTYGKGNDVKYDTFKLGDEEYIVYNNELMSAEEFNKKYGGKAKGSTGAAKPYDIVSSDKFTIKDANGYTVSGTLGSFLASTPNQEGKTGGWCGAYVNRYLKSIGVTNENYYDDNLSTKLNSVNTKVPKEGSIAVFDFGHITKETGQNHGHVGIVTKVYSDGSFDVIESNYNSDKKIGTRQHINPQSSSVKGFFDPSQPAAGTSSVDTSKPTLTDNDVIKAESMLKQIKAGQMTPSETSSARDRLIENGYGKEFQDALDKGLAISLTQTQLSYQDKKDTAFRNNAIVKEFESSINQIEQLQSALADNSGVGDMSAIFTFMKTLDPTSVVRESEFESAAATAGVLNPGAIRQNLEKSYDGKFLTPKQREDFKKIAVEFIKTKAKNYNIKYDELKKQYQLGNIPEIALPTNMADEILKGLSDIGYGTTPQSTNQSTLQSTQSSSFTPAWATKYSSSTSYNSYNYVNVEGVDFPSIF